MKNSVAEEFLEAVAAGDWQRIGACFSPEAKLRAMTPSRFVEPVGPEAIADWFFQWFGDATTYEFLNSSLDEVADRIHVRYLLHLRDEHDVPYLCEQHAYFAPSPDGHIEFMNLLCSGWRREER